MESSGMSEKSEGGEKSKAISDESTDPFIPSDKLSVVTVINSLEKCPAVEESKLKCRYLGLIYTLLSTNCFSLSSTILKKYKHISPLTMGIFSFPVAALLSVPFIINAVVIKKQSVSHTFWPIMDHKRVAVIMVIRAVVSSAVYYVIIMSFQYITVADTRTIMAASVITVYFFGWMCLGESCGIVPIVVAGISLCGIGVMTRPPILTGAEAFDDGTLIGVSLAVVCLLLATVGIITLKYLNSIHHGVLNTFLYTWAFVQSVIFALIFGGFKVPEDPMDFLALIAVGALMNGGSVFIVLALQIEEAGVVALIRTSEVVFTFFWQWVIVGVSPDGVSVLGAILVLTGVIVVTLRKYIASLKEGCELRSRLGFLLK